MPDRRPRRRTGGIALVVVLLTTLLTTVVAPVAVAQDDPDATEPDATREEGGEDGDELVAPGPPVDLGLYGEPVRFEAPEGTTIELGSGRRVVDTVEVRPHPSGNGSVVIAEMSMHDYVTGVAEMPARWPLEALKAQAVAARTYAWYSMQLGTFEERGLGYDICASTACQVFRGQEIPETPVVGPRWAQAVDETRGEVLLYEDAPILARYFSTSGGRTRNNEDVFPSSGAFPYLVGAEDPDDAVSPLHTWEAVFTREQFDDLLSRGETLGAVSPVAEARVEPQPPPTPDRVVVTGRDGTTAEVTAGQLRDFLNQVAPSAYPDQFPGPRDDGSGPLPSTVPSSRFEVVVTDDRVVLDGSGWGHGVGMGQYGARGKADRGLDHVEILAAYYNGLEPTTTDALPDRIRVGLGDQVDELEVRADGPMRVTVGDTVVTERALGTWRTTSRADRTTQVVAPAGYGAPLVVAPTTSSRSHPFTVEAVALETVVSKPAELTLEVRRGDDVVLERAAGIVDPGRHHVDWSLDGPDGPVPPGTYTVRLAATDEDGTTGGEATEVEVREIGAAAAGGEVEVAPAPGGSSGLPLVLVLLLAAAGSAVGALAGTMQRRRPRTEEPTA